MPSMKIFRRKFSLPVKATLLIILSMTELSCGQSHTNRKFLTFVKGTSEMTAHPTDPGVISDYQALIGPKKKRFISERSAYARSPRLIDIIEFKVFSLRYFCKVEPLTSEDKLTDVYFYVDDQTYQVNKNQQIITESDLTIQYNKDSGATLTWTIHKTNKVFLHEVSCKVKNRQGTLHSNKVLIRDARYFRPMYQWHNVPLDSFIEGHYKVTLTPSVPREFHTAQEGFLNCDFKSEWLYSRKRPKTWSIQWNFIKQHKWDTLLPIWYADSSVYWAFISDEMWTVWNDVAHGCEILDRTTSESFLSRNITLKLTKPEPADDNEAVPETILGYRGNQTYTISIGGSFKLLPLIIKNVTKYTTFSWRLDGSEVEFKGDDRIRYQQVISYDDKLYCFFKQYFTPKCRLQPNSASSYVLYVNASNGNFSSIQAAYRILPEKFDTNVVVNEFLNFRFTDDTPAHVFGFDGSNISFDCKFKSHFSTPDIFNFLLTVNKTVRHDHKNGGKTHITTVYFRGQEVHRRNIHVDSRQMNDDFGHLMAPVNLDEDRDFIFSNDHRTHQMRLLIQNNTYRNHLNLSSSFYISIVADAMDAKLAYRNRTNYFHRIFHTTYVTVLPKPEFEKYISVTKDHEYAYLNASPVNMQELLAFGVRITCDWKFDGVPYTRFIKLVFWKGNPYACKMKVKSFLLLAYEVVSSTFVMENPHVSSKSKHRHIYTKTIIYKTGATPESAERQRKTWRVFCKKPKVE